jgi:hypothetical protein
LRRENDARDGSAVVRLRSAVAAFFLREFFIVATFQCLHWSSRTLLKHQSIRRAGMPARTLGFGYASRKGAKTPSSELMSFRPLRQSSGQAPGEIFLRSLAFARDDGRSPSPLRLCALAGDNPVFVLLSVCLLVFLNFMSSPSTAWRNRR